MYILGIESSGLDTGAAVINARPDGSCDVLSNIVNQDDRIVTPTLEQALTEAGIAREQIDVIAVTRGPGMTSRLQIGVDTAKALAANSDKPIIGINHLEAYIASACIEHPHLSFPALGLLVSGRHTLLVQMNEIGSYHLVGETRDDAAGEAFDAVAKLLGLPYPGGPEIARIALTGNPDAYDFPLPMLHDETFDFSFSGLKTAIRSTVNELTQEAPLTNAITADIAASFQMSVVRVLVAKTLRAAHYHDSRTIILGGGVTANALLRQTLHQLMTQERPQTQIITPSPDFCTDNAAMVAVAAIPRALAGDFDRGQDIIVDPHLRLATRI